MPTSFNFAFLCGSCKFRHHVYFLGLIAFCLVFAFLELSLFCFMFSALPVKFFLFSCLKFVGATSSTQLIKIIFSTTRSFDNLDMRRLRAFSSLFFASVTIFSISPFIDFAFASVVLIFPTRTKEFIRLLNKAFLSFLSRFNLLPKILFLIEVEGL